MSTARGVPLWVPLVVGLIGLLGVLYTQWRSDRREAEARTEGRYREQEQWLKQEAQQRRQWAREDAARTYEQRRDSYLHFFTVWDQTWELVGGRYYLPGHYPERVPEDDTTFAALYEQLRTLKMFASVEVAQLAEAATAGLRELDHLPPHGGEDYEAAEALSAQLSRQAEGLRQAMRRDLSVPDGSTANGPAKPHRTV